MTQIDSRRSQDETTGSTAQVVETVSEDKGVTPSQVAGAALASVTAAVAGSTLGVAGTVIGAALASVIATVGSAYYAAWLRRGRSVVLRTTKAGTARMPVAVPVRRLPLRLRELPWKRVLAVAAAALVLGIAALTAVEMAVGRQIADIGREGGGGTTWGGGGDGQSDRSPDQRDEEQTPQNPKDEPEEPAEEPTDEPTPTAEPTEEPTPEEPTEEPTPSVEPTEPPVDELTDAPTTPAPAG